MFEIVTETEVAAPAPIVWELLTDTARYPSWNPLVVRFDGALRVGARATITLAIEGRRTPKIPIVVRVVDANTELAWSGGPRAILQGTHYFRMSDLGHGRTRVVHGERFVGLASRALPLLRRKLDASYWTLTDAIRREAERTAVSRRSRIEV